MNRGDESFSFVARVCHLLAPVPPELRAAHCRCNIPCIARAVIADALRSLARRRFADRSPVVGAARFAELQLRLARGPGPRNRRWRPRRPRAHSSCMRPPCGSPLCTQPLRALPSRPCTRLSGPRLVYRSAASSSSSSSSSLRSAPASRVQAQTRRSARDSGRLQASSQRSTWRRPECSRPLLPATQ